MAITITNRETTRSQYVQLVPSNPDDVFLYDGYVGQFMVVLVDHPLNCNLTTDKK